MSKSKCILKFIYYIYIHDVCVSICLFQTSRVFHPSNHGPGLTGNSECCQDATAPHHQVHRSVSRSEQLSAGTEGHTKLTSPSQSTLGTEQGFNASLQLKCGCHL